MDDQNSRFSQFSKAKRDLLNKRLQGKNINKLDYAYDKIPKRSDVEFPPASFAQESLWFLDEMYPDQATYNITEAWHIKGAVNLKILRVAINFLIQRHASLRTTFEIRNNVLCQIITDKLYLSLVVEEVKCKDNTSERKSTVQQIAESEAKRPFNLMTGPLIRLRLLKLSSVKYILLVSMHHTITDGFSINIFLNELQTVYDCLALGKTPELPVLPIDYSDFTIWQREQLQGERLEKLLDYWRNQLADSPKLILPIDNQTNVSLAIGNTIHLDLPQNLVSDLRELSRSEKVSLFMTMLTGFASLLFFYSGQDNFVIGAGFHGRDLPELQGIIGFFATALPLKMDLAGYITFHELLGRVKETCLDAFDHQFLPFEKIVAELQPKRIFNENPIFQVGINYLGKDTHRPLRKMSNVQIESGWDVQNNTAKMDISLYIIESSQTITVVMEYKTALFKTKTIEKMLSHYCQILKAMTEDPDKIINLLTLFHKEVADQLEISEERVHDLSPLTPTQRDLFLDSIAHEQQSAYMVAFSAIFEESINPLIWENALRQVLKLDKIACTKLVTYLGRQFQFVDQESQIQFGFVDFSAGGPDLQEFVNERLNGYIVRQDQQLIRNFLIKRDNFIFEAIIIVPHIIWDGYSTKVLFEQIGSTYRQIERSLKEKTETFPPSFYEYIGSIGRLFDSKEILTYWNEVSKTVEPISTIINRRTNEGDEHENVARLIDKDLLLVLQYCKEHNIRLSSFFLSCLGIVLRHYLTGTENFLIYSIDAGRHEKQWETTGCFYHVIPIVVPTNMIDSSITKYLEYIAHYKQILGPNRFISLFQQNRILPQSSIRFYYNFYIHSKTQILDNKVNIRTLDSFPANEVHLIINSSEDCIELHLNYNDAYLSDRYLLDRVMMVAKQTSHGAESIEDIDILLSDEKQLLLTNPEINKNYPQNKCLHERFEQQVTSQPESTALVDGNREISYIELDRLANQLAHALQALGVKPGTLVGLYVERSEELIVGVLGILKAGGAYLPLDPIYPPERICTILEDANVKYLVFTNNESPLQLQDLELKLFKLSDIALRSYPSTKLAVNVLPENLAYVIYTSGSTGKPKGVEVTHGNVGRLFDATAEWYNFSNQDVWTLFHSFAFDFSVWEIWGALAYGGRLIIVPYLISRSPEKFYDLLSREKVTVLNQTPSAFNELISVEEELGDRRKLFLRLVIFGGEALNLQSLRSWFTRHGDQFPQLINMYGITETTIHVTYRRIRSSDLDTNVGSVIGQPIPDLNVRLLNRYNKPVPIGFPGEIFVGGDGLARGYLKQPSFTAEKFVPDPFSNQPGARLYKSGDLARYLPNADIEYLGRIDHQVKIRGFRIELGEIEAIIGQYPNIRENVLILREGNQIDKILVSYLVLFPKTTINIIGLRNYLKSKLPDYMIPSSFVVLDSLPLTVNGKINRMLLPALDSLKPNEAANYVPPRNSREQMLVQIWENALNLKKIGVFDNFFEIGGHSILAAQIMTQIRRALNTNLSLGALFETPTIASLANSLEQELFQKQVISQENIVKIQNGSRVPFFCVHPVGGNIFCYTNLVKYIDKEQPFYGIQSLGLNGKQPPLTSIAEMAYSYIKSIQAVQAKGPYLLGGWSMGGVIAFEMARQLNEQNQIVAPLILIDSWAPVEKNEVVIDDSIEMVDFFSDLAAHFGNRFSVVPDELMQIGSDERLDFLIISAKRLMAIPSNLNNEGIETFYKIYKANRHALNTFSPSGGKQPILLLRASDVIFTGVVDDTLGWTAFTKGPISVFHVPGNHFSIMVEPYVTTLANVLQNCINQITL